MEVTSAEQFQRKWITPFFTIWTGQAFSLLGSRIVQFALIWWITKTTGSATALATATLVGLVPDVILGPFVGVLVDRWNRRLTMILADGIIALAVVMLAILFWSGKVQLWHVYVLMFLRSVAGSFHYTSMSASTSLMVPKEHLARVQGMNQLLGGGLNILAAPLGALALAALPMQGILAIDVVTAVLAIGPLLFIAVPQPTRKSTVLPGGEGRSSVWQDLVIGWRYVTSWTGLVIIGLMATIVNLLLTPAFSLAPILVTKHFGGQAMELAWIESALGIGVMVGGLTLSIWGGFRRRILTTLLGLFLMGSGLIVVGLAPSSMFWLAVGAFWVAGFANPICNGPLMAVVQATVAPDMQGRVFTLIGSFASAMSPLGLLIAGPLADKVGVSSWFLVGGLACILMALGSLFIPAVLHFEDGRISPQSTEGELAVPITTLSDV